MGRRDYAILLLLARLGLRAGEVVRLNLEDIDWENATSRCAGKMEAGHNFRCRQMSHEPLHVICTETGHAAPAGVCSFAITPPSAASTAPARFRAS